jgi:16S rRNA (guanine527-N7)-methyltransferase
VEHEQEMCEFMISSASALGLTVGEVHALQFIRYLNHLLEWNKTINLTAIIKPREIIVKHFIDSLLPLTTTSFPKDSVVLDVGSGGGFPGIPLKIVKPDIRLVLVEPVLKKCSFLHSVIGLLKLQDVSTFNGTIEQYVKQPLNHAIDTAVVRALKFLDIKKHVHELLASDGKVVLYRTESLKTQEIGEKFRLVSESVHTLPYGYGERVVSVIQKNNL